MSILMARGLSQGGLKDLFRDVGFEEKKEFGGKR